MRPPPPRPLSPSGSLHVHAKVFEVNAGFPGLDRWQRRRANVAIVRHYIDRSKGEIYRVHATRAFHQHMSCYLRARHYSLPDLLYFMLRGWTRNSFESFHACNPVTSIARANTKCVRRLFAPCLPLCQPPATFSIQSLSLSLLSIILFNPCSSYVYVYFIIVYRLFDPSFSRSMLFSFRSSRIYI